MRKTMVIVVLGVVALVAPGCGDDESTTSSDDTTTTAGDSADSAADDEPASADDGGGATVAVAGSDLGRILVDGEGRTLYLFTNDEPDTSVCSGTCAENWPPLEAPEELVAGEGVDESLLGTITRDDGTPQVAYASMPLYYYAADAEPGDSKGQGVGGVWYVVDPGGEAITAAAATAEAETRPGY